MAGEIISVAEFWATTLSEGDATGSPDSRLSPISGLCNETTEAALGNQADLLYWMLLRYYRFWTGRMLQKCWTHHAGVKGIMVDSKLEPRCWHSFRSFTKDVCRDYFLIFSINPVNTTGEILPCIHFWIASGALCGIPLQCLAGQVFFCPFPESP